MEVIYAFVLVVLTSGVTLAIVGHYQRVRDLRRDLADRTRERDDARAECDRLSGLMQSEKWSDWLRYQRRKEAESLTILLENTARDSLDALGRMSPEHLRSVIDQFAPHRKER